MDEERFSFTTISAVTGISVEMLQQIRRNSGISWSKDGYTVEEIRRMTGKLIREEDAARLTGIKSKALYAALKEGQ